MCASVLAPLDSLLSGLSGCSECSKLQSRLFCFFLFEKLFDVWRTTQLMELPAQVLVLFEEPGGGADERHLLHPLPPPPPLPLHLHLCSPRHAGLYHHHHLTRPHTAVSQKLLSIATTSSIIKIGWFVSPSPKLTHWGRSNVIQALMVSRPLWYPGSNGIQALMLSRL